MSRLGEGTGHVQVTAGGNHGLAHLLFSPRHLAVRVMDPRLQPRAHRLEICLSFSLPPTNAHVFKIGNLVFQVITLGKSQQDSPLLGFCYGFNKAFGFFFFLIIIRGSFPEIALDRLIHSIFSSLLR
jgi:hypothetical protein